jgi:sensor domain CHASE-containing protein
MSPSGAVREVTAAIDKFLFNYNGVFADMAWSIRGKLMALQTALLAGFVTFVAWQLDRTITGLTDSFERLSAIEDMNRVLFAFGQEAETLTRQARDYAAWNDTCAFIESGDQAYVEANLSDAMFAANAIDHLFLFTLDGSVRWGKTLAPPKGSPITLSEFAMGRRGDDDPVMSSRNGKGVTGLYRSSRGPLLLASQPIVTSHYEGPAHGVLAMGRFITEEMVKRIGERTRVAVTARPIERTETGQAIDRSVGMLENGDAIVIDKRDSRKLVAHALLRDFTNSPILLVEAVIPRHVATASHLALRAALLAMVGAGILIILLSFVVLNRLVIRPLASLNTMLDDHDGQRHPRAEPSGPLAGEFGALQRRLKILIVRVSKPH